MATTIEMTTQMFELLQSMAKRMEEQDEQIKAIHEIVHKKNTRKRSNPLLPYRKGLANVSDICVAEIKTTDQKVFIALVCDQEGEDSPVKIPVFSLTVNIFRDFMETYNAADDGAKIELPQEAKFNRRYAKKLMDTWTMPDTLK